MKNMKHVKGKEKNKQESNKLNNSRKLNKVNKLNESDNSNKNNTIGKVKKTQTNDIEDSEEEDNVSSSGIWEDVDDLGEELRKRKYYSIKKGIVIDNIPQNKSFEVCKILGIPRGEEVFIEVGVLDEDLQIDSSSGIAQKGSKDSKAIIKKKDIIRIKDADIKEKELNKIAIVAPYAEVAYIDHFKVSHTSKIRLPKILEGVVKCNNHNCVSVCASGVSSKFMTFQYENSISTGNEYKVKLVCHYCRSIINSEDVELI